MLYAFADVTIKHSLQIRNRTQNTT